jgi:hypothetical protein
VIPFGHISIVTLFIPSIFVTVRHDHLFFLFQEKLLCCQNRLLPSHYLRMQEVLMQEIFKGSVLKKEDAHVLFKVDPTKVDSVYDMVTKKLGNHVESPTV